jgi:hypothetical protein
MRTLSVSFAALAAALVVGAPAQALTITQYMSDQPLPLGQTMIEDFDNPIAAGFSFTQNQNAFVRSGALGLWSGVSAPPPGTTSNYETVRANGRATLAAITPLKRLTSFSFYLGSPDSYNTVKFYGDNGYQATLAGAAIWGSNTGANGNQGWGRRVSYDFGAERIHTVEFLSSGNSFEFDSLAGATANMATAVPEPTTWAMMILGFGTVGYLIRRRRVSAAIA